MCECISWIEKRDKVYYLTGKQLFSKKGLAFIKENGIHPADYCGHGTIRKWYRIDSGDGVDKECTDFSTPKNFPSVIVKAIKNGDFRGMGTPRELLTPQSYAHIPEAAKAEANRKKAYANWDKADSAWNIAYADRNIADSVWNIAYVDRKKAEANRNIACANWNKVVSPFFWDLFAIPENRVKAWQ